MLHAYDGGLRRVATATTTAPMREARDTLVRTASELDALEKVFPDKEQRRVDDPNHQEGE
jgi:hypothetical protein